MECLRGYRLSLKGEEHEGLKYLGSVPHRYGERLHEESLPQSPAQTLRPDGPNPPEKYFPSNGLQNSDALARYQTHDPQSYRPGPFQSHPSLHDPVVWPQYSARRVYREWRVPSHGLLLPSLKSPRSWYPVLELPLNLHRSDENGLSYSHAKNPPSVPRVLRFLKSPPRLTDSDSSATLHGRSNAPHALQETLPVPQP